MPPKSGFAEALGQGPARGVSLANRPNETTARAHLVLPRCTALESWGDYAAEEGVIGLMQPTMGPVQIDGKPVDGKSDRRHLPLASAGRRWGSRPARARSGGPPSQDFIKDEWQKTAKEYGSTGSRSRSSGRRPCGAAACGATGAAPAVALRPEAGADPGRRAEARGRRLARAAGLSLEPLLRRPRRRPAVAARGAGRDDPGCVGLRGLEIPAETAKQLGIARGDLVKLTSPHGAIELPAYPTRSSTPARWRWRWGRGTSTRAPYAQRGNAATGTQSQADFLNVGANPIELLPAAPDPSSGGLPLARGEGLARQDRRAAPARDPAGPVRPGRSRDRSVRAARRRARARAARQAARARRAIRACTRR